MLGRLLIAGTAAVILYSSTPALAQYGYPPPPPPPGPPGPPPFGPGPGEEMRRLRFACDRGDRQACIRFGIILGEHREYRRDYPDYFR